MKLSQISVIFIVLIVLLSGCSDDDINLPTPEPTPGRTTPRPIYVPDPDCVHFWKNPDCFEPYICIDCGEIKGEPLEHIWTIPNYQEASVCINCGEINGEPLEPKFTTHGLRINTTAGRPYQYKTITNLDPSLPTVGTASLLYIDIFESDTNLPAKAGYEYIVTRIMVTFEDENAKANGFQYLTGQLDFFGYNPDEGLVAYDELNDSDIPEFKVVNRLLNFYGEDFPYYMKHEQIQNEWIGELSYIVLEYSFLVPAGYDGIVIYLSNAANWSDVQSTVLSDNFDKDTLFFRLRTQTN